MARVEFPSTVFLPPPKVSIDLPSDWSPIIAPGAVLAARREDESLSFRPNVTVTWTRHPLSFDLQQAAAIVREELIGQPDAVEIDAIPVDAAIVCGAAFRIPEVGTIAQFHAMLSVTTANANDIVHFTGSVAGDRIEEDLGEVRELMRSIIVTPS